VKTVARTQNPLSMSRLKCCVVKSDAQIFTQMSDTRLSGVPGIPPKPTNIHNWLTRSLSGQSFLQYHPG